MKANVGSQNRPLQTVRLVETAKLVVLNKPYLRCAKVEMYHLHFSISLHHSSDLLIVLHKLRNESLMERLYLLATQD